MRGMLHGASATRQLADHQDRREFLATALLALATNRMASRRLLSEIDREPSRFVVRGVAAPFGPVKQIKAGALDVGYVERGPAAGAMVLLLHGWPYDIRCYAEVSEQLAAAGFRVIVPYLRGYGSTSFLSDTAVRNGQQSVIAADMIALLDALGVKSAIVGGCDWGARTANIMAALWPERCAGLVSVSGYLIGNPATAGNPLLPDAEYLWWYQYYFATERGKAGYTQYRREFARLIWRLASPRWRFDDATFEATAASFDNPDHVEIVIHNYRWRLGLAQGEPACDQYERELAKAPPITVPTITLEGDANGAPHPEPSVYAGKFVGRYAHRNLTGGIGHNLPQEAPAAFAQAVMDVVRGER